MYMAQSTPNFETIENIRCDKYVIDGNEACSTTFTRTGGNYPDTTKLAAMIISFQEGQKIYSFIYKAFPDNFDILLPSVEKMIGSFKIMANTTTSSLAQLPPVSSSSSPLTAKRIEGTQGGVATAAEAPSLQQIQSTSDSFKNNNNKTLQIISAAVTPIPGGIKQSMTGMVKNTGKDTLRFLTITAQILDSNHKVIGDVIAIAKNSNLVPGPLQEILSILGYSHIR